MVFWKDLVMKFSVVRKAVVAGFAVCLSFVASGCTSDVPGGCS